MSAPAIPPWEAVLPWMALAHGLEIRERLQATIDELDRAAADVDVPRTLAAGLLEDIESALADERADA